MKSVRVTSGTVEVSLRHSLDFVLLKPGEINIEVWSRGAGETEPEKLSEFSLDRDFVRGTPIIFRHDFSRDPATIAGGVRLVADVNAPADPATPVDIDLNETMSATLSVDRLVASAVRVTIDKTLAPEPQPITVDEGTVSEIVDRVTGPVGITITLVNPFPITVQGTFGLG